MIRDADTKEKKLSPIKSVCEVFMKGSLAPCAQIPGEFVGRVVVLVESIDEIHRNRLSGWTHFKRNGIRCEFTPKLTLTRGEYVEIDGDDKVYVIHPRSSIEHRNEKKKR